MKHAKKQRRRFLWPFRVPTEQLDFWCTLYGCKDVTDLEAYLKSRKRRLIVIDTAKRARRLAKATERLRTALIWLYAPFYAVAVIVRWVLLFVLAINAIFMLDWQRCKRMMHNLFHSNPFGHGF